MKIVLYDPEENNEIVEVYEDIKNPFVNGNNFEWEHGSLKGINVPFLLLDDAVDLSNGITAEIISKDLKGKYKKNDPVKNLDGRIAAAEMAILSLMNRS